MKRASPSLAWMARVLFLMTEWMMTTATARMGLMNQVCISCRLKAPLLLLTIFLLMTTLDVYVTDWTLFFFLQELLLVPTAASTAPTQVSDRPSSHPPASMTESAVWVLNCTDHLLPVVLFGRESLSCLCFPHRLLWHNRWVQQWCYLSEHLQVGFLFFLFCLTITLIAEVCFTVGAHFPIECYSWIRCPVCFTGSWDAKRKRVWRRWQRSPRKVLSLNNNWSKRPRGASRIRRCDSHKLLQFGFIQTIQNFGHCSARYVFIYDVGWCSHLSLIWIYLVYPQKTFWHSETVLFFHFDPSQQTKLEEIHLRKKELEEKVEALRTVKETAEQPEKEAKERHLKAWEGKLRCESVAPSSVCTEHHITEIFPPNRVARLCTSLTWNKTSDLKFIRVDGSSDWFETKWRLFYFQKRKRSSAWRRTRLEWLRCFWSWMLMQMACKYQDSSDQRKDFQHFKVNRR